MHIGISHTHLEMKKNVDIDDRLMLKLKILSAFEDLSVKALM
jgi:hypothetical protein